VIHGLNHVGLSVSDLDRSIEFYCECLGMEVVAQTSVEGDLYQQILALKGASGKAALLKRSNMQIELFEFSSPVPKPGDPRRPVCDHGITHFCIDVTDIELEYQRLSAAGVYFHCAPLDFGGIAKAAYARDPDGNVFELWERGHGSGK
jgi:glyoxylase I family protein